MARVFVDTNVLFPFSVMDLMLALTEDSVHEVLWTDALLTEWERVIVRTQRRSAESAAAITNAIREFFADTRVPDDAYLGLVTAMPGSDPDDRHHMAAAVAGHAAAIVTWNCADFPAAALAHFGIQVTDPDTYLSELTVELPNEVVDTIVRLAGEKRRPPLTPYDLADSLAKAGVPGFAARLTDLLDMNRTTATSGRTLSMPKTGRTRRRTVPASDISTYLAAHRPPAHSNVKLMVPPHEAVGSAAHAIVLRSILLEMLTAWPDGTTLVVDYGGDFYIQALTYPPSVLTEIGPLTPSGVRDAVRFGWIDPTTIGARHGDFESQPVWIDNPVREWTHPYDSPQTIAAFLAGSVRVVLGRDPGDGYTVHLFNTWTPEVRR